MLDRSRSRDRSKTGGAFSPAGLFANNEQGAWYDPSDFSTLYQDSTGTTPVTAVEQPVGLMLDRSGRGNHASQATSASRPVLRARYNLLTRSEEFDNAGWTKTRATVTANTATSPDGTMTADSLIEDATASNSHFLAGPSSFLPSYTVAATVTASAFVKIASGTRDVAIRTAGASGSAYAIYNLSTGLFVTSATSGSNWTFVSSSITALANGWYRIIVTGSHTETSSGLQLFCNLTDGSSLTYTGDGTSGILIWGAQLLTAADEASTGGAYQRIAAATDYDVSNPVWRPYLAFDGVDDTMTISSSINDVFQNVGGGTMWAGYTATAINLALIFISTAASANARAYLLSNRSSGRREDADSNVNAIDAGFVANTLYVGTLVADWAGGNNIRRTNGVQVASTAYSGGAGNTSNTASATAQIGVSLLNGRLYSAIILGRAATDAELTATESWIAGKTGVTL